MLRVIERSVGDLRMNCVNTVTTYFNFHKTVDLHQVQHNSFWGSWSWTNVHDHSIVNMHLSKKDEEQVKLDHGSLVSPKSCQWMRHQLLQIVLARVLILNWTLYPQAVRYILWIEMTQPNRCLMVLPTNCLFQWTIVATHTWGIQKLWWIADLCLLTEGRNWVEGRC